MRNSFLKLLTFFTAFVLFTGTVFAQGGRVLTEEEQLKQADKFFESKAYDRALPLYSQAVSNRPENAYYNYCLGVCLLKVDGDKADAVRFLTVATQSSGVPLNAWLYLGMALHRAYRYEEAITTMQKYKNAVNKQVWNDSGGEQIIAMCHNAINLNNDLSLSRHSILEEYEVNRNDFFTRYKDISETGRFLKLPKEYENKQTKDRFECSLLFLCGNGKEMVYTGPSVSGNNGLDIYKVEKDASGLWKFPVPIGEAINSNGDEAFPVLVNNGKTLYFSSNGSRSTGGYDVFRSDYDEATGTWSEPVGMGTPVNSPGDDYYYVPQADNKSTYFSSDRESPSGKCKVYTASVIREERTFITINGSFHCPAALEGSEAKITVLNTTDRSLMAQFRTGHNGTYFMKLPVPSKLVYQVKIAGFSDMESLVDLSSIAGGQVIQEIQLTRTEKGKESLIINTRVPETATPVVAQKKQQEHQPEVQTSNITKPAAVPVDNTTASAEESNTKQNENQPLVSIVPASTNEKREESAVIRNTEKITPAKTLQHPVATGNYTLAVVDPGRQPMKMVEHIEKDEETITAGITGNTNTSPVSNPVQKTTVAAISPVKTETTTTETKNENSVTVESPAASTSAAVAENNVTTNNQQPAVTIIKNTTTESTPATENNQKQKRNRNKDTEANVTTPVTEPVAAVIPTPAPAPAFQNVIFKVQLGAFRDRNETEVKKKFSSKGMQQLEFKCNDAGVMLVLTGNENSYESATRLKESVIQCGFRDAFIVAYSGEQRLPMDLVVVSEEDQE